MSTPTTRWSDADLERVRVAAYSGVTSTGYNLARAEENLLTVIDALLAARTTPTKPTTPAPAHDAVRAREPDQPPDGETGPVAGEGPVLEWAIEVTWADWKKAGAQRPTSQYGPFSDEERATIFHTQQRRDRAIAATRVLTRYATYTPWEVATLPVGETGPTSEAERDRLHEEYLQALMADHTSAADPGPRR